MPDLKIYLPEGMLDAAGAKQDFMEDAAVAVALALECTDYKANPIDLEPTQIDVLLIPYESANVLNGAPVRVEVTGYDYPDRMATLKERLTHVKTSLSRKVRHHLGLGEDDTAVTVSFIPLPDGCWV